MSPALDLHLIFLLYILLHNLNMHISVKGTGYILRGLNIIAEGKKKPSNTQFILVEIKRSYFKKMPKFTQWTSKASTIIFQISHLDHLKISP